MNTPKTITQLVIRRGAFGRKRCEHHSLCNDTPDYLVSAKHLDRTLSEHAYCNAHGRAVVANVLLLMGEEPEGEKSNVSF